MTILALLAAHPGHGQTDPSSYRHYLEPVHLVPVVLVVAAAIALLFAVVRITRGYYR